MCIMIATTMLRSYTFDFDELLVLIQKQKQTGLFGNIVILRFIEFNHGTQSVSFCILRGLNIPTLFF